MLTVYGIPNCDTVKKARTWLIERGIDHGFHDYKKAGIDQAILHDWVALAGWERLLNRAGTTFRKLSEDDKADMDAAKAIRLMMSQPSMIKRPVVTGGGDLLIGFNAAEWEARLG